RAILRPRLLLNALEKSRKKLPESLQSERREPGIMSKHSRRLPLHKGFLLALRQVCEPAPFEAMRARRVRHSGIIQWSQEDLRTIEPEWIHQCLWSYWSKRLLT